MFRDDDRTRQKIRYEAARIMVEDGVRNYQRAKQKACNRLGVTARRSLPSNLEIEDAVSDQLSLISPLAKQSKHKSYLAAALEMMECFRHFTPYLTGAALSGAITSSRPVELHLFPSTVEEFCEFLVMEGLVHELTDKRMRFAKDKWQVIPVVQFASRGIDFEVQIYLKSNLYPPLSATDRKPVKRASLKKVRTLHSQAINGEI